MDSEQCRECDHVAPVAGVMTVFASVEYPAAAPPDEIAIRGERYVRVTEDRDGKA